MTLLTEFGSPLEASIETDRRGYVGKPFDPLTGLYNYGYRDYRPELGRFTTVDPIRDGRNRYVYTANDPVNFIDPWGLAAEDGGKYNNYVDGPQLLNRYIPGYAFVEGGGFTGGISLSGSYTVRPNPDSTFDSYCYGYRIYWGISSGRC